jgi:hypothetical protein
MSRSLFIDPGSKGEGCACALYSDHELVEAWFERAEWHGWQRIDFYARGLTLESTASIDLVVVERPEVQGQRTRGANPGDLMNLSWDGASLAFAYAGRERCPVIAPTPTEWKGTEQKPIQHGRLWRVLTDDEREILGGDHTGAMITRAKEKGALKRWKIAGAACYPASFTTHNLLDAAALGCIYFGRLTKG